MEMYTVDKSMRKSPMTLLGLGDTRVRYRGGAGCATSAAGIFVSGVRLQNARVLESSSITAPAWVAGALCNHWKNHPLVGRG